MGAAGAEVVKGHLAKRPPLEASKLLEIRKRVKALQGKATCDGDYRAWIKRVMPADLG
ncbi:MAG: hypothetical protein ACHQ1G_02275 [Planctomycetota bacterium]